MTCWYLSGYRCSGMAEGIGIFVCAMLAAGALAAAVAAAFAARQARLLNLPDVVGLRGQAVEVRAELAALRAEWKGTLGALDAAMEALDDKADTIQRRRRRVEQAERREVARSPEAQEETDPMVAAYSRARALGMPV